MFKIYYKCPITGETLQAESYSIDEAVKAIRKAKEDHYFKNGIYAKQTNLYGKEQKTDKQDKETESNSSDMDYDDEYPYWR